MDIWLTIIMALLPALIKLLTDLLSAANKRDKARTDDRKPITAAQKKTRDQAVAKLREAADRLEELE